ncbi:MAG TPA: primosomal protein, partial [Dermatophilaceae bacterium]|nr:primosomal protein [Dermatophilaceae bacterium]
AGASSSGRGRPVRPERRGTASNDKGPRRSDRVVRVPDPAIPEGVGIRDLERSAQHELRTLSKDNAEGVAGHLVMVGRLLQSDRDADLVAARAHADTAVRRAGRVAAVREARGLVAYREADWQLALSEFRTARRLSGSHHLAALLADTERALGRPDRALQLAAEVPLDALHIAERIELLIVLSGIRRELGQPEAALATLRVPELQPGRMEPWASRLYYAYAEALLAAGDDAAARTWFAYAAVADGDGVTDASDRLDELDGVVMEDLAPDEQDETEPEPEPEPINKPGMPVEEGEPADRSPQD